MNNDNPDFDLAENGDGDDAPVRESHRGAAPGYTRVRMHIAYDGTDFAGWQRQRKQTHVQTIQGTLEDILTKMAREPVRVIGASRTDAGVHAHQQVAHFDWPKNIDGWDMRYAIQSMSPKSLVVKELFEAPRDFHAIAQVTDKIYKYRVLNRRIPSALRHRYTYWVRFPLNIEFLNEASAHFLGRQDFKAFMSTGTIVKGTVRQIFEASWASPEPDILEFTIRGDGFLKQMVRNIVGTVIDLNQEGQPANRVKEMLATLDRRQAGPTAPAQGLFLEQINYPEDIDMKCRRL